MTARGRFITLEGGEGAGKSTHARALAAWLRAMGRDPVLTREPGGTPHAEALRAMLLDGLVAPFGAEAEATVFAIARSDHMARIIRPALSEGRWVVCDRFIDSTRAYQGAAGVADETLLALERIAIGADRPDLTLVFDLPAAEGLARAARRNEGADRFEQDVLAVHEARRAAFLAIARSEPDRCVLIDATLPVAAVSGAVEAAVLARFGAEIEGRGG
ncbi:dTMP kinase [Rhizobiales bacterium L72]|uniref:Thymidylate kinase n=1 Tax=Propylenella binzhouense TaxID=2555902 RepID=A0A964T2M6_9HYPH|nr:dTMP kinase [Propylenella binzhouense]